MIDNESNEITDDIRNISSSRNESFGELKNETPNQKISLSERPQFVFLSDEIEFEQQEQSNGLWK